MSIPICCNLTTFIVGFSYILFFIRFVFFVIMMIVRFFPCQIICIGQALNEVVDGLGHLLS